VSEIDEATMEILAHLGTQSLILGATLAVINQEIPSFKTRALTVLATAALQKLSTVNSNMDAQAILSAAMRVFEDLE
jgi:hypothetical protein